MNKSLNGLAKRPWKDTFLAAFNGIAYALRTQRNLRVHMVVTLLVCLFGLVFEIDKYEWLWLGLSITLVIATEMMNTAIESVVDLVTSEWHPLAKVAKDTAAGAVLITAVFAIIVGICVFAEPILRSVSFMVGL